MGLSYIDLNNQDLVSLDKGARSLAYFCRKLPVRVNMELIGELKNIVSSFKDKNVRLCLHDGPQAVFQNMIIIERKDKYYRPHKHLNKGESFHIIEGKMAVFTFGDSGNVIDSCILEQDGNIVYRVAQNSYHAVMPITDLVIYHEAKPGPFLGQGDSIFPEWSAGEDDKEGIDKYKLLLMSNLKKTARKKADGRD